MGRYLPRYHDTTRLHAAHHYSQQAIPIFRSTTERFGNGVDLANRGVKAGANVALSGRECTPGVGTYMVERDRLGRRNTMATRASTLWHV